MAFTRREWLGLTGAALAQRAHAGARPILCIFSKHLAKLQYSELGPVVKQMGFDGVDLTVRPFGHVLPERAPHDLARAIEMIRGEGLQVPMITTDLVRAGTQIATNVLGIAGGMKVPYYKPGYWRYSPTGDIETRLAEVKANTIGLIALGKAYGMAAGFHNHSGDYVGAAVWDIRAVIGDIDPRWVGYYFDPCHATAEGGVAGWKISMQLALPRLKMVALKDFYWEKSKGKWEMKMCPMGQGMVDWPKVFSMLAEAHFAGPISLHMEYEPPDEVAAIVRDFEFVKKQVEKRYGAG